MYPFAFTPRPGRRSTTLGNGAGRPWSFRCAIGRFALTLLLWIGALASVGRAQLISYSRALLTTPGLHESTSAYQLEYRQGLIDNWSASIDYLNEGHLIEHHRDGYAFELGYRLPVFPGHAFYIAASAGPYYFFDTVRGAANVHGVAPIVSLSAYGALYRNWFWSVTAARINPSTDLSYKANLVGVGIGYWLGEDGLKFTDNLPNFLRPADASAVSDEVTVSAVFSVINIAKSPHSLGSSVEYRHRFAEHFEGTLTYIYEGDPRVVRRSGLAAQAWPVRSAVIPQIEIGVGAGAYVFIDRRNKPIPGQNSNAAVGGLISMMASYKISRDWSARFIWDRVVTDYSRDADIWRLGLGVKL